jgi:hypothetical protein
VGFILRREKIMIICAKTFKVWLKANFSRDELKDIARHGANAGWHGLIYYSDTSKLYKKFESELWDHLFSESESHGYDSPLHFLASLNGAKNIGTGFQLEALIVHFAAESYAFQITKL